MKLLLISLLLLTPSLAIKIKIRTPKGQSTSPSTPAPGGWRVKRSCKRIAPNVEMGSVFSIYAEQLYNIFNDPINELLLVRHEAQVVAGMNRRMIFRVRDKQTNDTLYIGISVYIDLQGSVRVTGYLESFDISVIVNALGFSGNKQFRYRCGEMNAGAVDGFKNWANNLLNMGNFGQQGNLDNFDNFDDFNGQQGFNNQQGFKNQPGFNNQPQNNYGNNFDLGSQPQYTPQQPAQQQDPFGGSDSPFEEKTININIEGRHPDGSKFLIGSSRPKKKND